MQDVTGVLEDAAAGEQGPVLGAGSVSGRDVRLSHYYGKWTETV